MNFGNKSWRKWDSFPIKYKFDGKHGESQKIVVRKAFNHWEDETCIRFSEEPLDEDISEPYILLTAENTGCHSYVGKVGVERASGSSNIPQQV